MAPVTVLNTYIHIHTYAYTYIHIHTRMHTWLHTYIRTYIHRYIYMQIYILISSMHTHIFACMGSVSFWFTRNIDMPAGADRPETLAGGMQP